MKKQLISIIYPAILFLMACSNNNKMASIENPRKGKLKQMVRLVETAEKKFLLDSTTAPKIQYSQMYTETGGRRYLTFLNRYNKSIYFYDYETLRFIKKWVLNEGNEIIKLAGYHIISEDSVYAYNRQMLELLLVNGKGDILSRSSLIDNKNIRNDPWTHKYPQYIPQTAIPFLETSSGIVLAGQRIGSIQDSIIGKFKFVARFDHGLKKINFNHLYPYSLYGFGYKWEGEIYTEVYTDLLPGGNELVFSFPVSHDLYLAKVGANEYEKIVYGGSNQAGTISSMNAGSNAIKQAALRSHFLRNDEYGAIKYDKYRKLYYRFLRKAIPNTMEKTDWKDKPIVVIVMDENFNYLGETVIGNWGKWYLQNVFVTKEGLNIEYIEDKLDESFLTLKIFNSKPIK